ncbi:MAG: quinone-dependent dihydroorotate dehydrogenase [Myxococcota bacterium]
MNLDGLWPWVRPLVFALDAEPAHEWTMRLIEAVGRYAGPVVDEPSPPGLEVRLGPLTLPNPVGLAAGLDKNGVGVEFWPTLGFGFVEVGTVTAHAQPGNPRPRLFRLPESRALVNRLGFNNRGSEAMAERLRALRHTGRWPRVPIGANVGKSKITPNEEAPRDYALSVRRLAGLVDWFTINVSSPNTVGLRSLQAADALARIVEAVLVEASGAPVFVKLAPDLTNEAIADAVGIAREGGITAIVATNTTIQRPGVDTTETGGLSGRPLWPLAKDRIGAVIEAADGLPVIGVGGIETATQISELIDLGCTAIQLYTSFIYEGPGLPRRLTTALAARRAEISRLGA